MAGWAPHVSFPHWDDHGADHTSHLTCACCFTCVVYVLSSEECQDCSYTGMAFQCVSGDKYWSPPTGSRPKVAMIHPALVVTAQAWVFRIHRGNQVPPTNDYASTGSTLLSNDF